VESDREDYPDSEKEIGLVSALAKVKIFTTEAQSYTEKIARRKSLWLSSV
jgi:hypothetical protein